MLPTDRIFLFIHMYKIMFITEEHAPSKMIHNYCLETIECKTLILHLIVYNSAFFESFHITLHPFPYLV